MLDRFAGQEYYYFLDVYFNYNQMSITLEDQEKMIFTYIYRTYAFRWMLFGLWNAPPIFQRCMMVIFYGIVKDLVEEFMGDFSIFITPLNVFEEFEQGLNEMWKNKSSDKLGKGYFLIKKGIILRNKGLWKGLEVDQVKVEVIEKLPPLVLVKKVHSFSNMPNFMGVYKEFFKGSKNDM